MFNRKSYGWGALCGAAVLFGLITPASQAAEGAFFITYTHQMEEPGNLEVTTKNVLAKPAEGRRFLGSAAEFEYGIKGWWTTEVYLDGQAGQGEAALFTGYRSASTGSIPCSISSSKTSTGRTRACWKW